MSKYIPTDKLIAEIERLHKAHSDKYECDEVALNLEYLEDFIDSLQQDPRFPQYDNIVDKVFGAGNLEGWERDEAEMLVALAKEELLKSLQQEQPEVDLVAELKHHLATTPKEQLEKEWKELEPWGNIGPTVQEFLYGKQPEDIVVIAKTFLDALSKTPYNNKPITDAQIIVKQLLLFFENPLKYNPDAIVEQPEVDLEKEIHDQSMNLHIAPCYDELESFARHFYEFGRLSARKGE